MKRVLNVGGNNKGIALPAEFAGWDHVLLDIDPAVKPDVLCDARALDSLAPAQFDAVYCSHNLEHYYRHDVRRVLAGFRHVLKPAGFALVRVPNIREVLQIAVERDLDLEDVLYNSTVGPITVHDVIYGFGAEIERSGSDFFAHKTGFSSAALTRYLTAAGFANVYLGEAGLDIVAYGFSREPDAATRQALKLG